MKDEDTLKVKLSVDREYAQSVFPMLKKALNARSYAAVFRTAFNLLVTVVRIYLGGHKLVEIDEQGKSIGVIHILGMEITPTPEGREG